MFFGCLCLDAFISHLVARLWRFCWGGTALPFLSIGTSNCPTTHLQLTPHTLGSGKLFEVARGNRQKAFDARKKKKGFGSAAENHREENDTRGT